MFNVPRGLKCVLGWRVISYFRTRGKEVYGNRNWCPFEDLQKLMMSSRIFHAMFHWLYYTRLTIPQIRHTRLDVWEISILIKTLRTSMWRSRTLLLACWAVSLPFYFLDPKEDLLQSISWYRDDRTVVQATSGLPDSPVDSRHVLLLYYGDGAVPRCSRKAQRELDSVLEPNQLPSFADQNSLPLLVLCRQPTPFSYRFTTRSKETEKDIGDLFISPEWRRSVAIFFAIVMLSHAVLWYFIPGTITSTSDRTISIFTDVPRILNTNFQT